MGIFDSTFPLSGLVAVGHQIPHSWEGRAGTHVQTLTDTLLRHPFLRKLKSKPRQHLPDITLTIFFLQDASFPDYSTLHFTFCCLHCVKLSVFQTNAPIQWEAEWGRSFSGNINNSSLRFHNSFQFLCISFFCLRLVASPGPQLICTL